jgi:large subunit ribosomal protein L21
MLTIQRCSYRCEDRRLKLSHDPISASIDRNPRSAVHSIVRASAVAGCHPMSHSPIVPRVSPAVDPTKFQRNPMYAVIETGGKQYRVEVGMELEVESLDVELGKTVTIDRVLLVADGDDASIGRPVVDGAAVSAEVVRQTRGDKVIVFKYGPKTRRRVKKGHRQELTVLRISDIVLNGKSAAKAVAKADTDARTERRRLEEAAAAQAAKDAELAAKLAAAAKKPAAKPTTTKPSAAKPATAEKPASAAKGKAETTTEGAAPARKTTTSRGKASAAEKPAEKPAPKPASKPRAAAKPRTTKKDE